MTASTILWRRLETPGHDFARLVTAAHGSVLHGMAAFLEDEKPTALQYMVRCDAAWQTTEARIIGWRGELPIELVIVRSSAGRWSVNGAPCSEQTDGCTDLDLSFTPATNLLPLRRLALAVGHRAEVRSAWLDWPADTLVPLVQRYVRKSANVYGYEADVPGQDRFAAVLHVDEHGWVRDYAGLWRVEAG